MYFVYYIMIDNRIRYVGITNNIKKRQYQHNYDCWNKQTKKTLYNKIRLGVKSDIVLNVYKRFSNKLEAELFEAYLILKDHFEAKELWQTPPKKIRYF